MHALDNPNVSLFVSVISFLLFSETTNSLLFKKAKIKQGKKMYYKMDVCLSSFAKSFLKKQKFELMATENARNLFH